MRPLYQRLQRHGFNGDGRTTVRPLYQRLQRHGFNGDGRTTVRPLYQRLQRQGFNGDGRTTVRPYKSLHVMASISVVTRLAVLQRTPSR